MKNVYCRRIKVKIILVTLIFITDYYNTMHGYNFIIIYPVFDSVPHRDLLHKLRSVGILRSL